MELRKYAETAASCKSPEVPDQIFFLELQNSCPRTQKHKTLSPPSASFRMEHILRGANGIEKDSEFLWLRKMPAQGNTSDSLSDRPPIIIQCFTICSRGTPCRPNVPS
jgi:hypothetical protein